MSETVRQLREPPHSIPAEQALLGAVMLEPKAYARVASIVKADDFYNVGNREIWRAIAALVAEGLAPDTVALIDRLEKRSGDFVASGGRAYAAELVATTPSAASVVTYAGMIREASVKRGVGNFAGEVGKLVHADCSASAMLQRTARLFAELYGGARTGRGLVEARLLIGDLLDDLDRRRAGERGLSIGLDDFDRLSYGLDGGDLVVLAARPGMGKTATLVSVAAHVSASRGVAVFSAEMPATQLMRRCVATLGGIAQSRLRDPERLEEGDWATVGSTAAAIAARRLWIDDTASPSLDHLRGEVLALQTRSELGLVMVDYVQLVEGKGNNRYEQLRDVAYGLKALAKETRVPIVLLAQLNRSVDGRDNKRPHLSDLRDSGAIEEAADIVGMLYCEGYYDKDFGMPYVLECAIEKNRNGERGQCLWHFAGEFSRVTVLNTGAAAHYRAQITRRMRPGDDL